MHVFVVYCLVNVQHHSLKVNSQRVFTDTACRMEKWLALLINAKKLTNPLHVSYAATRAKKKHVLFVFAARVQQVLVMADRFCVTTIVVNALRALMLKSDKDFSLQICERVLALPESITTTEHFAPLRCRVRVVGVV